MTAINIVAQPDHRCIHVLTDGAVYEQSDARVVAFGPKACPVPAWPGVIATRGDWLPAAVAEVFIAHTYATFDDLVDGIEDAIASNEPPITAAIEFIFAGWSEERQAPEAYLLRTTGALPPGMTEEQVAARVAAGGVGIAANKLIRLPDVAFGPMIPTDEPMRADAGYTGINKSKAPEAVIADMLIGVEIQRRLPRAPGRLGSIVGGSATITTVTPNGITQRVLRRWPDVVGAYIEPEPPDWPALRRGGLAVVPEGESRLKREMRERRDRKAGRR